MACARSCRRSSCLWRWPAGPLPLGCWPHGRKIGRSVSGVRMACFVDVIAICMYLQRRMRKVQCWYPAMSLTKQLRLKPTSLHGFVIPECEAMLVSRPAIKSAQQAQELVIMLRWVAILSFHTIRSLPKHLTCRGRTHLGLEIVTPANLNLKPWSPTSRFETSWLAPRPVRHH